uniref:C2H2-type domain-containing protein n=1 Tax=Timema tahoe TaxID=61484 RepID=A0A7R9IJ18_9NEOP|nr:unnamed protein product [Timema tahoe]
MGQKENIFLNYSALGENSKRSGQEIIEKKHVNLFKKVCDFKDSTTEHNNTKQNLISTLQRKYRCNICNKDFKEKRSLNKHLLNKESISVTYVIRASRRSYDLNRHLLIHSAQRKYKCDVCDKSFKTKNNLKSHLLIHSKQRKYKCDVCNKSFKGTYDLNRHLLIHSEQRKYKFFFHFFLPLFIAGLLLLPDYIGIVEDAPNCDVIVCCYVLLIHVVLG